MSKRLIVWLIVLALLMGVPPAVFAQTAYNLGQGVGVPNTWSALQTFSAGLTVSGGVLTLPSAVSSSSVQLTFDGDPTSGIQNGGIGGRIGFVLSGFRKYGFDASFFHVTNGISFSSSVIEAFSANDLYLVRDSPNTLAIRNGSVAQAYYIYKIFNDNNNYERLAMWADATNNVFHIDAQAAGIGVLRNIAFMGGNIGIGTTVPGVLLDLGLAGTTLGVARLAGNTSGNVTIQPASVAGTWTFKLPTSGGTANYALTTDGTGISSWSQISLTSAVTGILPVANGGTGIAYFTVAGPTIARVYTFPDQAATILYSGGALGTPSSGTATNFTGLPLTTGVTGILPGGNGGTNNGFFQISGPATSLKTFTLPNASANVLTDNAAVTVAQGGIGLTSGTSGGILGFTASGTLASSVALTANVLVKGGGAGATPTNSLITDNGTTAIYTGTGGYSAPILVSTVATGTAPLTVTSTTNVANLNASSLNGATFAAPGAIGSTTPSTGKFTTLTETNLLISNTAPTISSGFGTTPSIANNNGTAAFTVNVGTGGTASSGVIGLPVATTGWNCYATDITTTSASVFMTKQTASSTTTATFTQYNTSAVATAWAANDILAVSCFAY